jgi:tetratricopeptide (TPR) repeat protein
VPARQNVVKFGQMPKVRKKNNSAPAPPGHSAPAAVSKRRKWFFRLTLLILSPLIFFAVLEGVLRLAGFGYPTSFFLHERIDGQKRVIENRKFGWRFFGPALARTPYPLNFAEEKPTGTIRIFVLGESAAYGDPQPDFGLPRVLEALLRERYPNVHFEVINAAMVAINSHVILPIARDCAREHGDIWLVYMGNNEVVGPFGSGTVFGSQVPPLPLIRANLRVKSTRTGQLLSDFLAHAKSGGGDSAEWRGMMMFVQHQVRQDDPRMVRSYSHFKQNLTDIVRSGIDSGAKVIVSTVASNLKDCAPFGSQHSLTLTVTQSNEWSRLYQMGIDAEAKTNALQAIHFYEQAAKIDDHFADLQYRWAKMCLLSTNESGARNHFVLARDYDTLRFRTDSRLNGIIRESAGGHQEQGIYLLDAAEELAKQSQHGICGEEFFYEHVHFTFEGNYALARMFANEIAHVLPPEILRQGESNRNWMTADECAQAIGWNDWSKYHVLESLQINVPPFNFQLNHAEMLQNLNRSRQQLAQALTPVRLHDNAVQYRQLISAMPNDWVFYKKLAEVSEELNDPTAAVDCWTQVEKLIPQSPVAPSNLHSILLNEGKFEQAADQYEKALKLDKNFTEGTYANWLNTMAGKVLQKSGPDAALPLFSQAISLKPNFAEAHIGRGTTLKAMGKTNEAKQEFRMALRHPPTTPLGLVSLGNISYQEGWTNEAIRNLEAALSLDPTDSAAHFDLGVILYEQQRTPAALDHFQKALQFDQENKAAQTYLDRLRTNHIDDNRP